MRRTRLEKHFASARGFPLPRVLTMTLLLAVMAMLYYNMRNPARWRWLAPGKEGTQEVAPEAAAANSEKKPAQAKKTEETEDLTPTGPTDLDEEERDKFEMEKQAVFDKSVEMKYYEMQAYKRLMRWAQRQPLGLLRKRAEEEALYGTLVANPYQMRGKIFKVELDVRQIVPLKGEGPDGADLYELHGFSPEMQLYLGVVPELPEGMPCGRKVQERVVLYGYFFKLQGYEPRMREEAQKSDSPLLAPIIVGRLMWQPSPLATPETPTNDIPWLYIAVGLVVAGGLIVSFVTLTARRPMVPPRVSGRNSDPDAPSVDDWLDQAQSGELTLGNNSQAESESKNGHAESVFRDQGGGLPPRFSGDFDTTER